MNPNMVAQNRTARLVAEARTPAYSTVTPTAAQVREARIREAEDLACGEDWCHVCSRATDHFGEHDDEQILAWANRPGRLQRLLKGK